MHINNTGYRSNNINMNSNQQQLAANSSSSSSSSSSQHQQQHQQQSTSTLLPDEDYIERLFPKCPPKQSLSNRKPSSSSKGLTNNNNNNNNNNNKTKSQNKPQQFQKKQAKSKVHQYSRRELEARRGKKENRDSESSDDESRIGKANILRDNLIKDGGDSSSIQKASSKKNTKYTASQSLLQQLHKSQSSYNNSSLASGNKVDCSEVISKSVKDAAAKIDEQATSRPTVMGQEVTRGPTGIVKSVSSFAFATSNEHASFPYPGANTINSERQSTRSSLEDGTGQKQEQVACNKELVTSFTIERPNLKEHDTQVKGDHSFDNNCNESNFNFKSIRKNLAEGDDTTEVAKSNNIPISYLNSNISSITDNDNNNEPRTLIKQLTNNNLTETISTTTTTNLKKTNSQKVEGPGEIENSLKPKFSSQILENSSLTIAARQTADLQEKIQDSFLKKESSFKTNKKHNKSNKNNKIIDERRTNKVDGEEANKETIVNSPDFRPNVKLDAQNQQKQQQQQQQQQQQKVNSTNVKSARETKTNRYRQKKRSSNHLNRSNNDEQFEPIKDNLDACRDFQEEKSSLNLTNRESIREQPSNEGEFLASNSKPTEESISNFVSIQHHAGQQLLTADPNDNNDDNIVRNDASTEELCNVDDTSIGNREVIESFEQDKLKTELIFNHKTTSGHRISACTLASVDEKAEIDIEETETETFENLVEFDEIDKTDSIEQNSDKMPANSLSKRTLISPGYPQRIRPTQTSPLSPESCPKQMNTASATSNKNSSMNQTTDILTQDITASSYIKDEVQRVKFDEENLVRIEEDRKSALFQSSQTEKHNSYIVEEATHTRHDQMPVISESQHEIELESSLKQDERNLSIGLNKISLANNNYNNLNSPDLIGATHSIRSQNGSAIQADINNLENIMQQEPSSVANNNNASCPRSSSMQFNTLSDNDSGSEELPTNLSLNKSLVSGRNYPANMMKKSETAISIDGANVDSKAIAASTSDRLSDDDLTPTTKTALIFPRLDEGLSSEAESNEDDGEVDDERAMEADVDADDDDDDDDVDDEDENEDDEEADDDVETQTTQSRVDTFMRQQHFKHQNNSSSQQHLIGQQTDINNSSIKPPNYSGNYSSQNIEPFEHSNDLKSMNNNYSNQNGQSNYWMNMPINHQALSSSQQVQHQFSNQRNHLSNNSNNNTITKNNSTSFNNREEVKATDRLSSDTDNETDRLLGTQRNEQLKSADINNPDLNQQPNSNAMKQNQASSREVLIEGVLFNVKYLGSTHSDCEGRSEKEDRIHQAEMAVHEVKFRNGENQTATEVQLFISTEKIMVLDDDQKKIMMDHSLRTISYIADIGDAIVLIVRKKSSSSSSDGTSSNPIGGASGVRPISKISCHVFESSESHTITKSISQAFQVAYTELLKANGVGDGSGYIPRELDYQEVLNSQEMSTDELEMFARKENQREVVVPKKKGEILGLSIVESGWGSVLPTVVIANLKQDGPAYNCKKLSIGDQILSVNGVSLVGLPLAECQEILRKTKNQRVAKLSVVPCPVTVEVKIKRPDTKYQLGFSVQNGVICSLLRGGIAERGGVRVGHRIMSINGTTVVGVPHEKIVTLLASSVGEIRMKTCLTSLYRLMLGEENPVHF